MNRSEMSYIIRTIRNYASDEALKNMAVKDLQIDYYDMSERDAKDIERVLSSNTYHELANYTDKEKNLFVEGVVEGLHGELEGYNEADKVVIELFLDDLVYYVTETLKTDLAQGR